MDIDERSSVNHTNAASSRKQARKLWKLMRNKVEKLKWKWEQRERERERERERQTDRQTDRRQTDR